MTSPGATEAVTPEQRARELLDRLRWRADQIITNHAGERVWLVAIAGGVTDCCLADEPCDHHVRFAQPAPARNQ